MSDEYANITLSDLTPEQINELSSYGYVPTEWICILYLVLFGLTTGTLDPLSPSSNLLLTSPSSGPLLPNNLVPPMVALRDRRALWWPRVPRLGRQVLE